MADDEVEKFEITDFDLENEFSSGFKRKGLTKEQQIYGIWAEAEEREDGDMGAGSVPAHMQQRYLQKGGLNFVAGGIQQAGNKKNEKKDDDDDDDDDIDMEEPKPMFKTQIDSSDEEDHLPLEFASARHRGPTSSNSGYGNKGGRKDELAGFRRLGHDNISEGGIGDWEKHTTGIGSKLMKLMGYEEGKGLGKNLQGIATPLEAQKRKGKGAIGFYGSERAERSQKDFQEDDSDEDKLKEERQHQWKKSGNKKKIKYIYKSAEEVIQEGRNKKIRTKDDNHITKTKVIDMTGPETRVLSSYHAIGGQKSVVPDDFEEVKKKKYEHFDLPELIHNLQILLEKSEDDIIRNAKTVEKEENRIVHLNHERERYEILLDREEKELQCIDDALALIEKLDTKHTDKVLTLSEAAAIFRELQENHAKVYYNFEIAYLAPTYIVPLLKEVFSTWNPLANPQQHMDIMAQWQQLVERNGAQLIQHQPLGDQPMDPYQQIVWETWASALRSTVMGPWEPRDCDPLIIVLETWVPPVIPAFVHSHILQNVVLPRITRAVHNWNPREDTVPIHTWLHPWLPMLSDHLQGVYPVIRQKLISALVHWHPSDRSAKMVLQPWKSVFSEVAMTSLIQFSILPKIESSLMEMPISPHNQKLDPWHWFTDWEDLLPPLVILDVLERCFFPRWYQAIGSWLSTNPPYKDVIAWYKGWRDLIPTRVVNHMQMKQKFQQVLEICKRALSFQPGSSEQFSLLLNGLDKITEPPPPPPIGSPPRQHAKDWADIIGSAKRENLSMKEVVERRCLEKGLLFRPLPDKSHEGRPIYKCGNLNISFIKNIIYVQTEKGWMPKSLTTLLDDA